MLKRLLLIIFLLPGIVYAASPILIIGDSLSAAYGINARDGWVELLQQRLNETGYSYTIVNASISGETTSGALSRAGKLLTDHKPAVVVIALGGNDGLRGLPTDKMYDNLAGIIKQSLAYKSEILLVGIHLPPNYGPVYTKDFSNIYHQLADRFDITLLPTLLEGVEENHALFQEDGFHPGTTAQPIIVDNLWRYLLPLLKKPE